MCIDLEAAIDDFVEDAEVLTMRLESTDRAVVENTSLQVILVDISIGKFSDPNQRL